jgi:hypothetical protein
MSPPGDCTWREYLPLLLSVESAKSLVSSMGRCEPGDSCTFLALKIAAITAEIAARVARDTACFRGGDQGHRDQVDAKVNMLNRCWRYFNDSNCPPGLVEKMTAVVVAARAVIEAAVTVAAAAVVVALVAALIAAIIALAEFLAAAAAAAALSAAEAAAIGAAVAALLALVGSLRENVAPAASPPSA